MLIVNCDSFKVKHSSRKNEIEITGNVVIKGNSEEVLNSTNLCFNEVKEYFESRGYKIEIL